MTIVKNNEVEGGVKRCLACWKLKLQSEFYNASRYKEGELTAYCRDCQNFVRGRVRRRNRERNKNKTYNDIVKQYGKELKRCGTCTNQFSPNNFRADRTQKDGLSRICKVCCKISMRTFRSNNPWYRTKAGIRCRCRNINHSSYMNYGGRGIKDRISLSELKVLWFRDEAYLLKRPSIDRIDSNGDYTPENCRYIELTENSRNLKGPKR